MLSIRSTLTSIDQITNTTDYKKQALTQLKDKLSEIDEATDLSAAMLNELVKFCNELLQDKNFVYKKVSLFGGISRCEKILRELLAKIENRYFYLYIEKLQQLSIEKNQPNIQAELTNVVILFAMHNYAETLNEFSKVNNTLSSYQPTPKEAINNVVQVLKRLVELQLPLYAPNKFYTGNNITKILDNKFAQPVFGFDYLAESMQDAPENTSMSFIYVIDSYGNVLFSPDVENSRHMNVISGKPAIFAGEIYLERTGTNITLTKITNKSAFYKPDVELFEPLKEWFSKFGLNTAATKFIDARLLTVTEFFRAQRAFGR